MKDKLLIGGTEALLRQIANAGKAAGVTETLQIRLNFGLGRPGGWLSPVTEFTGGFTRLNAPAGELTGWVGEAENGAIVIATAIISPRWQQGLHVLHTPAGWLRMYLDDKAGYLPDRRESEARQLMEQLNQRARGLFSA